MGFVMLDAQLMSAELARINLRDRGFINAEKFQVRIRVQTARPLALERHIQRLADTLSAPEVTLPFAVSPVKLARDIATLCSRNDIYDCLALYTLTPGSDPELLPGVENPPRVTQILSLEPLDQWRRLTDGGVRLHLSTLPRLRGDRTARLSCGESLIDTLRAREAQRAGADLAAILDQHGNLLQAAGANIFAAHEGALYTPHLERDGVYPGVWREVVMDCAARLGIVVYQQSLEPDMCARAEEFFLTSSALEIAPVKELAGRSFKQFPLAARLLLAVRERLAKMN